ncbi:uncharacterized protein A1O9_06811 [Exophiala aquamarina CBS 119918]|uniref:Uncharacterized protein n=1 Tax=Exophiala aquamarina CBS 119918 TaxID=1182545 RepID=A0A072PA37_9EURO|nr:uncharacterized protein A1O9_06811 [Exophiala aquamarina CBS 119918]KEF56622.1 hypothetical protein A1O9_06811 [Exophiala aquamarina CBS 119918]
MSSAATQETLSKLAEPPSADTVTLLLKCHKSTTLLSVLPTTPFAEIKGLLLAALQTRGITTLPNSMSPLPENGDDLEFGVLVDQKDASKGWVPLEIKEQEVAGSKGGKKKAGGTNNVMNANPVGAGLSDGSWIAYRLKVSSKDNQTEEVLEEGTPEIDIPADIGWDVVLPTFEDEEGNE